MKQDVQPMQDREWRGSPADVEQPRAASTLRFSDQSVQLRLALAILAIPLVSIGFWFDFPRSLMIFASTFIGVLLIDLLRKR